MTSGACRLASAEAIKRRIRADALDLRRALKPSLGAVLADHLLATPLIPPRAVVGGFWPLEGEIDIRPLLHGLVAGGRDVLLPETPPRGQPLTFRRWQPSTSLQSGRFGTQYPDGPEATPDVLLVPLLAFDARCHRLGYGGGYYDRTIAGLPGIRTIGCAFAAQQVDAVPVLPHDIPLDAVATEAGILFRPES